LWRQHGTFREALFATLNHWDLPQPLHGRTRPGYDQLGESLLTTNATPFEGNDRFNGGPVVIANAVRHDNNDRKLLKFSR